MFKSPITFTPATWTPTTADDFQHYDAEKEMEPTSTDARLTPAIRRLQENGNRGRWCPRGSTTLAIIVFAPAGIVY